MQHENTSSLIRNSHELSVLTTTHQLLLKWMPLEIISACFFKYCILPAQSSSTISCLLPSWRASSAVTFTANQVFLSMAQLSFKFPSSFPFASVNCLLFMEADCSANQIPEPVLSRPLGSLLSNHFRHLSIKVCSATRHYSGLWEFLGHLC